MDVRLGAQVREAHARLFDVVQQNTGWFNLRKANCEKFDEFLRTLSRSSLEQLNIECPNDAENEAKALTQAIVSRDITKW